MSLVNVLIGLGGGPTSVINSSLAHTIGGYQKYVGDKIGRIYVAIGGIKGVLNEDFVDVTNMSKGDLEKLSYTICASSGSSRDKLETEEKKCNFFNVLSAHDIKVFNFIGGGDSASTVSETNKFAEKKGYPIISMHIMKTIDNDGYGLFSPGWGTCGLWQRDATLSFIKEVEAMPGVCLGVSMGRDSGWITAMTTHAFLAEGKDKRELQRIYTPETGFSLYRMMEEAIDSYGRQGSLIINVSEGIVPDGEKESLHELLVKEQLKNTASLSSLLSDQRIIQLARSLIPEYQKLPEDDPRKKLTFETLDKLVGDYAGVELNGVQHDQHGQVAYGEIRSVNLADWLAQYLQTMMQEKLGKKVRVRGNTFGYMQRCPVNISAFDLKGARLVGEKAAETAIQHIYKGKVKPYSASIILSNGDVIDDNMVAEAVSLDKIANLDTGKGIQYKMPRKFMTEDGPTKEFLEFSRPLVEGEIIRANPKNFINLSDPSVPRVDKKLL